MKPTRLPLSALAAAVLLLVLAPPAFAAVSTVTVSPVPGNPTASGSNLLTALAGIVGATSADPFLLKLEPGTYDIGTSRMQMKPWVDIEGSGLAVTVIQGEGNLDFDLINGVVWGSTNAELRELTVKAIGSPARPNAIAIYNQLSSPRFRQVGAFATGGTANWGIRNHSASPLIEQCEVTVRGGTQAYGIVATGASSSARPVVRRTVVNISAATNGYGFYSDQISLVRELRDVQASVNATSNAYGFYADVDSGAGVTSRITGSTFTVSGKISATGIHFDGGSGVDLFLETTQARASGTGTNRGMRLLAGALIANHVELAGSSFSLDALILDPVRIGASQLNGPRSLFNAVCAASYDGSFNPISCP